MQTPSNPSTINSKFIKIMDKTLLKQRGADLKEALGFDAKKGITKGVKIAGKIVPHVAFVEGKEFKTDYSANDVILMRAKDFEAFTQNQTRATKKKFIVLNNNDLGKIISGETISGVLIGANGSEAQKLAQELELIKAENEALKNAKTETKGGEK